MHINVKWGIYAGIAALFLAFVTSIILGQASFSAAILRGLGFAALFFVLGTGVWTVINTFMPELLIPDAHDAAANVFGTAGSGESGSSSQTYGSNINITLGDRGDAALPDSEDSGNEEVGNIADLVSGAIDPGAEARKNRTLSGLDGIGESGYNEGGGEPLPALTGFGEAAPAEQSGGFTMNFDSFSLGGGAGNLEPFGDTFSLPGDLGGSGGDEEVLPERKVTGNKPMALEGDFNPKDIAAGIRTVLEKDKRG
jgi:hypothetical protein